jgi:long-chain acyl-CoA synthetase
MQQRPLAVALESACIRHGSSTALTGEGIELSYQDLWQRAGALANHLVEIGSIENEPVMVRRSNHPSDFVAFLGVWIAGGLVVPVHRTSPPEVVRAIQAKARCPICVDMLAGAGKEASVQALAPDADADESRAVRARVLEGGALVIFTSGSTGLPKGAVLSHAAFLGKLQQNQRHFQAGPDTASLLVLNNTFSFGIWVALMTLMEGGKIATLARFTPQAFVDTLCAEQVSFVGVVPTMIRAAFGAWTRSELNDAKTRISAVGRLRQVVIGGESLGRQLSEEVRSFIAPAELFDVYGLTETSTSDFVLDPQDYADHPNSIGKTFPGIRYRLVDAQGEPCHPGAVGELQLLTPYIMAGYLGDAALTDQAFNGDWFRTGDLATAGDDGFVTVVGRLKELIVRGGNKITPLEVELALLKCDGVANAMVAGVPDAIMGQRIHALLVAKPGAALNARAIRQGLSVHLEKYKAPDAYYIGDALPTGRTGKLDRGQLQRLLSAGTLDVLAE